MSIASSDPYDVTSVDRSGGYFCYDCKDVYANRAVFAVLFFVDAGVRCSKTEPYTVEDIAFGFFRSHEYVPGANGLLSYSLA